MAGNVPGNLSHAGLNGDGGALTNAVSVADGGISDENRKVFIWVAELLDPTRREAALMELSKKREQVPELALVIWHSFGMALLHRICCLRGASCKLADIILLSLPVGVMTALLQEIISVYPLLNPSQLTAAASNRVCNALALLQCVASHNETRTLFLNGMYMKEKKQLHSLQEANPCFSTHSSYSSLPLSFPQYHFEVTAV